MIYTCLCKFFLERETKDSYIYIEREREMESSLGVGFMAVFAVTGSVVLLAHQIHKRLLSDFMKDIEFELGGRFLHSHGKTSFGIESVKRTSKKTVRFADDVVEPSSNNKEYRRRHMEMMIRQVSTMEEGVPNKSVSNQDQKSKDPTMPTNRQALYRGIVEYKALKGQNVF